MEQYLHLHKQFNEALHSFLPELNKKPQELYEPMSYILSLGGKRLRPVLALIGNELFNGNPSDAIPSALAVELFHNFSLIHDDIMDKAPLRRGKETVHIKWNENIGILSGDAMLVKAYECLTRSQVQHLSALMQLFNKTALEVCEGQQLDMNFENRSRVSIEEYLHMISLKTAVLLGCSLQMGAITANQNANEQLHVYEFGRLLGVSFQLKDDILDAFGDSEKVGKQTGGDIIADKKTYLLLKAYELATPSQVNELNKWIGNKQADSSRKVSEVLNIFNDLKIRKVSEEKAEHFYTEALNHLNELKADSKHKQELNAFAEWLLNREH